MAKGTVHVPRETVSIMIDLTQLDRLFHVPAIKENFDEKLRQHYAIFCGTEAFIKLLEQLGESRDHQRTFYGTPAKRKVKISVG